MTEEETVNTFVTALTDAGYSISPYLLHFDADIDATVLKDNMFSVAIRHGRDIERSGGNVAVPLSLDFVFCFTLPLISEGGRAGMYITRSTTTLESVKDIIRQQQIDNFFIIEGDTPLPATNTQDFLFIHVIVSMELCHNYKA